MKKILILLLSLFFSADVFSQDSLYLWPTNSGRYLSSTFGETRSAHFHSGLDIKTWGREGYKVYASKDGILSRLLITNQGYGKAIYLKHNDGSFTVYAHLQRFNTEFQSIADSIRMPDYSYTFEKFLENENIKVKKGDVIGFTGSTGIGPPHLHFEIRNKDNQPINPLQFNFDIGDKVPPKFSSILIEPLDIDTRINGSVYPDIIYPSKFSTDTTFFDTLSVTGKFGFSPYIFDEANSVTNKYAVYKTSLLFEGDTLYHEEIDKFDFSEANKMFVNRVPSPLSNRRRFQRLFLKENISHPFLVKSVENRRLASGIYKIIAEDYFGNRTVAIIPVETNRQKESSKKSNDSYDYWTNNWISINDSSNIDLAKLGVGALWDPAINQRIVNLKKDVNFTISRIEPDKSYSIVSPDFNITSIIESQTFFDTVSILQNWDLKSDTIFIEIGKPEIPTRKNIVLQLQLGNNYQSLSHTNLYSLSDDKDVKFIDSWVTGSTLNALIGNLGKFVVLTDTTSPKIYLPKKISLANGLITYTIKTEDDLSGIDYQSAIIIINNQRGIPEYDYENNTFTFYLPWFVATIQDSIYVELKDKAGNFFSKSFLLKN